MDTKMPVIFAGHGSPMNAIEKNMFSDEWEKLGQQLPHPKGIIAVSAHWYTEGTRVCGSPRPRTVYDMYGFPDELYKVTYPAPGDPELAARVAHMMDGTVDNSWGIDHGIWSVLHRMFPAADIPVIPVSVDKTASPERQLALGRQLRPLRDEGFLIFASGNVVHNLFFVDWRMNNGYDWADAFDAWVRERVTGHRFQEVLDWEQAGGNAQKSFETPEHFAPLLYALGAAEGTDTVRVWNDARTIGSISMTSYLFN